MGESEDKKSAKVVKLPKKRRPSARCPICGKPATEQGWPFCSTRCANVDLGRWLDGGYRIHTEEAPEEGSPPPPDEE